MKTIFNLVLSTLVFSIATPSFAASELFLNRDDARLASHQKNAPQFNDSTEEWNWQTEWLKTQLRTNLKSFFQMWSLDVDFEHTDETTVTQTLRVNDCYVVVNARVYDYMNHTKWYQRPQLPKSMTDKDGDYIFMTYTVDRDVGIACNTGNKETINATFRPTAQISPYYWNMVFNYYKTGRIPRGDSYLGLLAVKNSDALRERLVDQIFTKCIPWQ